MTANKSHAKRSRALLAVLLACVAVLAGILFVSRSRTGSKWSCTANSIERSLVPASFSALPKQTQQALIAKVGKTRSKYEKDVRTQLGEIWAITTFEWLQPDTKKRVFENLAQLSYAGPRPKMEIVDGAIRISNADEVQSRELPKTFGAITSAVAQDVDVVDIVDSKALFAFRLASVCTNPNRSSVN